MKNKFLFFNNKNFCLVVLLIISLIFLLYYYNDIILSPNNYLFSKSGDGIKAYYAAAYYIKDVSFLNLDGMNYPYGENIVYPDAQPGISVVIKIISTVFPFITDYTIGILNFLMLFSFVFTTFFLWLILNRYIKNYWFNLICSFGIAVMSPQIFRITGHITMVYSCFIPISWYILIRNKESLKKIKWSIISISNILFWYFVHPYMGLIITTFYIGYYFFDLIFKLKENKKLIRTLKLIAIAIIPTIVFNLFVFFSDTHVGRPRNPYGFLVYISDFTGVFLPIHGSIHNFLHNHIHFDQFQYWEGWAYIGLLSLFSITLYLTVLMFYYGKYGKLNFNHRFLPNKDIKYLILCSICMLLFSMGYPFRWNLEFIADKFTIIKQFRSVGRFAWVFYYVICVSSVIFLYNIHIYFNNQRRKIIAYIIFFLPILYSFEGMSYHKDFSNQINKSVNLFDIKQLKRNYKNGLEKIDIEKYQAIIPIPMFCIGTDNYTSHGSNKIMRLSFVFSYHTQLPILGKSYARTSMIEAKKTMQIISPSFYPKMIANDIVSDKNFLVIYSKENISEYEKNILDKCEVIYEAYNYVLYSISKDKLFENTAKIEIDKFIKMKDSLYNKNGFYMSDTNRFFYFDDFDDHLSNNAFKGPGCFQGKLKNNNCLAEFDFNRLSSEKEYIASFWLYNWGDNYGEGLLDDLAFVQENYKENKSEWTYMINPGNSFVINDKWSLVEIKFKPNRSDSKIIIGIQGPLKSDKPLFIDNFMMRENNTTVYKVLSQNNNQITEILKNNHIIKLNK